MAQAKRHLDTLIVAEQERKEQERIAAAEARRQKMEAEAAAAWNSIKNSNSPVEVQAFIKRFPESSLALRDATERLGALDREAKERVARAQAEAAAARAAWDRIKDTNDIAAVQDFIKQYPNTPTALNDAKQYLDVLDKRIKEREAKARMEAEAAQTWNRIQNTTDQAEVRSFIKRYPDSAVALTDAAQRLAALEREAADRADKARADAAAARAAWELVKGSNDPAELRDYIDRYPDSPFSTRDARARIDLLERQAKEREAKARADAVAREAKEKAELAVREAKEKAEAEMLAGLGQHQGLARPVRIPRLHQALPELALRDERQAVHRGARDQARRDGEARIRAGCQHPSGDQAAAGNHHPDGAPAAADRHPRRRNPAPGAAAAAQGGGTAS